MRQICLSRQLIPQSFFDDLRKVPEPVNANAIAISSISEEDRERLTDKLRQEVSDDADCAVSKTRRVIYASTYSRFASTRR